MKHWIRRSTAMNPIKNIMVATALSALSVGYLGAAHAAETVKPLQGVSFDIGTKHAVSYFLSESGQCRLTVLIADAMKGDEVPTDAPIRFDVAVDGGKDARVDTAEGKSLQFACAPDSQAMIVDEIEQVATYSASAE
jgi:hypothetical protein